MLLDQLWWSSYIDQCYQSGIASSGCAGGATGGNAGGSRSGRAVVLVNSEQGSAQWVRKKEAEQQCVL